MTPPTVSVILPVRDGGVYLRPALESILAQQGVAFELIVVDDGSSDETAPYLASIGDPRLRVVRREGGGLVAALNAGAAVATAPYLARMDADDIALPGRLARQAALLDAEPEIGITYAAARVINADGRPAGRIDAPDLAADARRAVLLGEREGPPIIHPTVMMRREVLAELGGYRESPVAEDHDLWLRAVDRFGFRAIAEPLLDYRHLGTGVSRARAVEQSVSTMMNRVNYRVACARGVDLFAARPEIYAALRRELVEESTPLLTRIAEARRIRSELRRGRRLAGLVAALRFAFPDASLLTRSGADRRLSASERRAERRAGELLDGSAIR